MCPLTRVIGSSESPEMAVTVADGSGGGDAAGASASRGHLRGRLRSLRHSATLNVHHILFLSHSLTTVHGWCQFAVMTLHQPSQQWQWTSFDNRLVLIEINIQNSLVDIVLVLIVCYCTAVHCTTAHWTSIWKQLTL